MVVKEYQYGESRVRIHDDYAAKTERENQAIVDRIAGMVTRHRQMQKKETGEKTA